MNVQKNIKNILSSLMIMSFVGCGGSPSISVLPATDSFEQSGQEITAKMDILWVIDNSGSMEDNQLSLVKSLNSFIENFVGKGYDFRMAVTKTDAFVPALYAGSGSNAGGVNWSATTAEDENVWDIGCGETYVGSQFLDGIYTSPDPADGRSGYRIISSDDETLDFNLYEYDESGTPAEISASIDTLADNSIQKVFKKNIFQGDCGSGSERGLESAARALLNSQNVVNEVSFPRPDAHLAIIIVSDEEDHSEKRAEIMADPNNLSIADYYHTFFTNLASADYKYSLYAATISDANGAGTTACVADESTAEIEEIYSEIAQKSGGGNMSLCAEDFSAGLQNIAQSIIERTVEFSLSSVPASPEALEVSVKNVGESEFTVIPQSAENGWTYNAIGNSIVFHGTAIPAQGSQISFFYDPDGL